MSLMKVREMDKMLQTREEPILTLYLCEQEERDGYERYLDIAIQLQPKEGWEILEEITLSREDAQRVAERGRTELFLLFGIKDLRSRPGYPKGPYYWVGEAVWRAIRETIEEGAS